MLQLDEYDLLALFLLLWVGAGQQAKWAMQLSSGHQDDTPPWLCNNTWVWADDGGCHQSGANCYGVSCEYLWDLGRFAIWLRRRAESWVADRVGFTLFHLVIWVPLLPCLCWCVWWFLRLGFCLFLCLHLGTQIFCKFLHRLFNK